MEKNGPKKLVKKNGKAMVIKVRHSACTAWLDADLMMMTTALSRVKFQCFRLASEPA
jgi:hypothetical protein